MSEEVPEEERPSRRLTTEDLAELCNPLVDLSETSQKLIEKIDLSLPSIESELGEDFVAGLRESRRCLDTLSFESRATFTNLDCSKATGGKFKKIKPFPAEIPLRRLPRE